MNAFRVGQPDSVCLLQTRNGVHCAGSRLGYLGVIPISFAIDGKQYVAVTTGLGGGSTRGVPATLTPDIYVPERGHALYVFALPSE